MQLRYRIFLFLAHYPKIYIPYTCWRDDLSGRGTFGGELINNNTEIIIDGFPRSANSFAVAAFDLAQNKGVKIAHHRHDPAQVIAAVKSRVPAVVLVRNPRDAVISLVIRNYSNYSAYASNTTILKKYLTKYVDYYEPLEFFKNDIIFAEFETVTKDFNCIISAINKKFSTSFNNFIHDQQNVDQCFEEIDNFSRKFKFEGERQVFETAVSRPSDQRKEFKKQLIDDFQIPENIGLYSKAGKIYEKIKSYSI
jgi:hypothetical protein